jgi:hypothetical protein
LPRLLKLNWIYIAQGNHPTVAMLNKAIDISAYSMLSATNKTYGDTVGRSDVTSFSQHIGRDNDWECNRQAYSLYKSPARYFAKHILKY